MTLDPLVAQPPCLPVEPENFTRRRRWHLSDAARERRHQRELAKPGKAGPETCIYFIRAGEFVKIGKSGAWKVRIRSMQTGSPYTIVPLLILRAPAKLERDLHIEFIGSHFRGEWFYLTKDIGDYIRKNRSRCVADLIGSGESPPRPAPFNLADDLE